MLEIRLDIDTEFYDYLIMSRYLVLIFNYVHNILWFIL